ncbi:alpha/beta fold hydrolase [Vibrio ezurae]|uniref:2-succinyl-6-hydroxy-2,4-cyclohexadiene-1-carboxylate synthase n=1 Tax=Vibrio ezurae NBRC 102218 TaxID=1219080 RepID=U3B325_9VIBR|nr:alpha/beta fold hydrolase [Vibrio ezurae]GAD80330.1 2-succinyl-6-hydroxy-2,4-cyclohexadiene-1-carboxylate synthase [Vibrio ezurae NBRC 102218]
MPQDSRIHPPLRAFRSAQGKPTLRVVFVHGFLGSAEDWHSQKDHLPICWDLYAIDLPGHGHASQFPIPDSIDGFVEFIDQQLQQLPDDKVPLVLVGYSLGARLLMHFALTAHHRPMPIAGFVFEGGNFGLQKGSEKQERWENDRRWITRFSEQTLPNVLQDWYQQKVFASLSREQIKALVEERSHNAGAALAQVMSVTSLAHQDYLRDKLCAAEQNTHLKTYYIVGEHDVKFMGLYTQNKVPFSVILGAGHNTHKEQPYKYAQKLTQLLSIEEVNSI